MKYARVLQHILLCAGAFVLLFPGLLQINNKVSGDVKRYQCYTMVFWYGQHYLKDHGVRGCNFIGKSKQKVITVRQSSVIHLLQQSHTPQFVITFVEKQDAQKPYHTLPYEYPLLTLLPLSLNTITGPLLQYQSYFALVMLCCVFLIYALLARYSSQRAAIIYLIFTCVLGWSTAALRYDVIPALLTVGCFLAAQRKRWILAYMCIALAIMNKFYPLVLLPILFLAHYHATSGQWYSPRRYIPEAAAIGICLLLLLASALLNVEGTIAPFTYFTQRPLQVEAVPSSFNWAVSVLGGFNMKVISSYGSRNLFTPLSPLFSSISTLLSLIGLTYGIWLYITKRISLAEAFFFNLLITVVVGKVLSPQYFLWLTPFLGCVQWKRRLWIFLLLAIGVLTIFIYPFLYESILISQVYRANLFLPVIFIRNMLFVIFTAYVVVNFSRRAVAASPVKLKTHSLSTSPLPALSKS